MLGATLPPAGEDRRSRAPKATKRRPFRSGADGADYATTLAAARSDCRSTVDCVRPLRRKSRINEYAETQSPRNYWKARIGFSPLHPSAALATRR